MAPTLCSLRRTAIRSARICASMITSLSLVVALSPVVEEAEADEEGEEEEEVEEEAVMGVIVKARRRRRGRTDADDLNDDGEEDVRRA